MSNTPLWILLGVSIVLFIFGARAAEKARKPARRKRSKR